MVFDALIFDVKKCKINNNKTNWEKNDRVRSWWNKFE